MIKKRKRGIPENTQKPKKPNIPNKANKANKPNKPNKPNIPVKPHHYNNNKALKGRKHIHIKSKNKIGKHTKVYKDETPEDVKLLPTKVFKPLLQLEDVTTNLVDAKISLIEFYMKRGIKSVHRLSDLTGIKSKPTIKKYIESVYTRWQINSKYDTTKQMDIFTEKYQAIIDDTYQIYDDIETTTREKLSALKLIESTIQRMAELRGFSSTNTNIQINNNMSDNDNKKLFNSKLTDKKVVNSISDKFMKKLEQKRKEQENTENIIEAEIIENE